VSGPPRVSILLPAWNAAATLQACLASITRQSEPAWQCIIVDDGSDDGTERIAARFARDDGRFRVLSTPHRGIIEALNTGLRLCEASLVARMDADDVMCRERLRAQADFMDARPETVGVGTHVRIFPRARMKPRLRDYEAWLNSLSCGESVRRDAFVECPVAHPTLMMRREMAALGYRDAGWPEDYDLVLRALQLEMRLEILPRRLHLWRDREAALSRTDPRYAQDRFTACKAQFLADGFLREASSYVLWGYGGTGRALRRALAEHGRHPSHIVEVKRSRLRQVIHGAPVIAPGDLLRVRAHRVIVSVARAGPRAEIRAAMAAMGFSEGRDFVCAA